MNSLVTPAKALDVATVRADFPILGRQLGDKPLVYLDNAATSQKPRAVLEAVRAYDTEENANIHRGVHALSQRATEAYDRARATVARHLNADDAREIVFTRNATEASNLLASSFAAKRLGPGDNVILTQMEHHAVIVPWVHACEKAGAELRVLPIRPDGTLAVEKLGELIDARTKLFAFVQVSNALGTVNPAAELIAQARESGVPVLLDASQAVPHGPVDVQRLGCDFLIYSGHKVFAPTGIGVLYARQAWLNELPPYQRGGDMITSVAFDKITYNAPPEKFEAGTPNIAGAIGLAAALEYLDGLGWGVIAAQERLLREVAVEALSPIEGLRILGPSGADAAIGVVSFVVDGVHPHDIGTFLDQDGVAIRAGHHCAQPLMKALGVNSTARASFAFYNTVEEIEILARAVQRVISFFR